MITPRVYQGLATKVALKGLRSRQKRALVVLATGLGKTLAAAFITKKFRPRRMLFLVHNNFILDHAVDEYQLIFDPTKVKMATYNGHSKHGADKAHFVFSTWQTMGNNLKKWKRDDFDLIVVDEAHHTEAETYRPVVDYFTGAKLGITATPDREDDADIRDVFGPEVINVTLEEAIARGWLPRIEYHVVTDESLDEHSLQQIAKEIRRGKKRFTMAEVNRRIFIRKRDQEIARIIDGYKEKTIVFCASIKHAERINKSLGLSKVFHSQTGKSAKDSWNKNQATLAALKNGIIRQVCAVDAFNEGVNAPNVGLVAFCRVTGSLTIFRQQLGRGLRPGKDKLIVLDFVGNLERIKLVLEMMNKVADLHERYTSERERNKEGYGRSSFEVSGKGFEFTFSEQIVDLVKVLEHVERDFYPTWQEASQVAVQLGIASKLAYERSYLKDPRLPSSPSFTFEDFPGWEVFLGKRGASRYETWQEAAKAAENLGIKNYKEYRLRYKEDPRLPANPPTYRGCPGWRAFFGKKTYPTWQKAGKAARKLSILKQESYIRLRKQDPLLPSNPSVKYADFPGWPKFLGRRPMRINGIRKARR